MYKYRALEVVSLFTGVIAGLTPKDQNRRGYALREIEEGEIHYEKDEPRFEIVEPVQPKAGTEFEYSEPFEKGIACLVEVLGEPEAPPAKEPKKRSKKKKSRGSKK